MIGVARAAAPFSKGFDCLAPVSADAGARLRQAGFEWVGRYFETLTAAERDTLFQLGFGIKLITTAARAPLYDAIGAEAGVRTVALARALEAPNGLHITIDLEATGDNPADRVADYVNNRAHAVNSAGYESDLYVGAGQPLNGAELYKLAPTLYWRGGSAAIPEPACGWSILQLYPTDQEIEGQRVDVDIIQCDYRGRLPVLWWPT
jgi:hypothetical protein